MALTGMDIEAVRQLAQMLNQKSGEIRDIMNQLNGQIQSSNSIWVGNDAEQFRNDWQSSHVPALNQVAEGLEQASQRAAQNAAQQEQASA